MNKQELAKMIDQTLLKPYVSLEDLRRHCVQAAEYGFKTVAINNAPVPFCKAILKDSGVLVDAAVSFPLGQCTIETKVLCRQPCGTEKRPLGLRGRRDAANRRSLQRVWSDKQGHL